MLGEEADLEAQTFSLAQMPIGSTNVQFSTKPAFLPNVCYNQCFYKLITLNKIKMSKQTALQELRWFVSDGLNNFDESIKVSEIWDKINELLEKEKQQIKDAYLQGDEDGFHSTESMADYETEGRSDYVSEKYYNLVHGVS